MLLLFDRVHVEVVDPALRAASEFVARVGDETLRPVGGALEGGGDDVDSRGEGVSTGMRCECSAPRRGAMKKRVNAKTWRRGEDVLLEQTHQARQASPRPMLELALKHIVASGASRVGSEVGEEVVACRIAVLEGQLSAFCVLDDEGDGAADHQGSMSES